MNIKFRCLKSHISLCNFSTQLLTQRAAELGKREIDNARERLKGSMQQLVSKLDKKSDVKAWRTKCQRLLGLSYGKDCQAGERVRIPFYYELDNLDWIKSGGPRLLRFIAKEFKIIDEILPYATEASINLNGQFGEELHSRIKRGNIITPDLCINRPVVDFEPKSKNRWYTVLLLDADFPNTHTQQLEQLILWQSTNINGAELWEKSLDEKRQLIDRKTSLRFIPPHPQRGSSMHRCLLILLEHETELEGLHFGDSDRLGVVHDIYKGRAMDIKKLIEEYGDSIQISGYSFFRTCWTKTVSEIYSNILGIDEQVFGNKIETYSI